MSYSCIVSVCRRPAKGGLERETHSYTLLNLRNLRRCPAGGFLILGTPLNVPPSTTESLLKRMSLQGMSLQGMSMQGMNLQGMNLQCMA
jgi:hypothetical protein